MKHYIAAFLFALLVHGVVGPPVTEKKPGEDKVEDNEVKDDGDGLVAGIEYTRYLKEVVQALESDPQFREKLEKAEVVDIRTGKIAKELEFVNHNVRTKLDELKRQELERLRHFAIQEYETNKGIQKKLKLPQHLDHKNPHTFEIDDLRKLIVQTTKELEKADMERKEEFKEYEMQKKYEKEEKMKLLDEEHQKKLQKELEEQQQKHKQHPSLHHPGSKPQLEEVWEEQDHMSPEDFNPKTFFYLHDLDGNGFWDTDEVKALFQKELDKMYDPNAPEDDMRERIEEMERMREHVFNESDTNKDQLISYQEFLEQTKKAEFEQDQGWEGLDQQQVYTEEEYREFERRRQQEVQRMIDQGLLPPQPIYVPPGGMPYPQGGYAGGPQYQQYPHPQGQQFPQGGYAQQPHPGAYPQGQMPVHPSQGSQYYPQGQHPNQVPNAVHQQQPNLQQHQVNLQQQQQYQANLQQQQQHQANLQQQQQHQANLHQQQQQQANLKQQQQHQANLQQQQQHQPNLQQQQQQHQPNLQQQQHQPNLQQQQHHPNQQQQQQQHQANSQQQQPNINQGGNEHHQENTLNTDSRQQQPGVNHQPKQEAVQSADSVPQVKQVR